MLTDLENQAASEGSAIATSNRYQLRRPSRRRKAPLKPVPSHLKKRRDRRPLPQRMSAPCVPKTEVPDWLETFLERNS